MKFSTKTLVSLLICSNAVIFSFSQTEEKPIILITNDDGFEHEYIKTLASCFQNVGKVILIAPQDKMGGSSNKMTRLEEAVIIKEQDSIGNIPVFSVKATPATVVRWAIKYIETTYGKKPDILLSGINPGVNVGASVYYSGTIGAARQGALMNVSSLAISIRRNEPDLKGACEFLKSFVSKVIHSNYKTKLFNVNFPSGKITENTKVIQTVVDPNGSYLDYTPLYHPRTKDLYFFSISRLVRKEKPGSDIYEVVKGNISITPLLIEYTSLEELNLN